jgi:hypothetical protein
MVEDINGKRLQEGQIIAYPVRSGLEYARVLKIIKPKYQIIASFIHVKLSCAITVKKHYSYKNSNTFSKLNTHNASFYSNIREKNFIITDINSDIVDVNNIKTRKKLIKEYVSSKNT